ncbi:MAG: outer membrane beta-barrel protein [Hyphomicrobiaceae bacterium]
MRARPSCGVAGLASAVVAALALTGCPASAEDLPWDDAKQFGAVAVRDRPRTAFEPDGIRIGNYVMLPELGYRTTISNDDLGTGAGRNIRHELTTAIDMRSQLPRHLLDVKLEGRAVADQEREDLRYIDGKGRVVGRLDISHATSLFGEASAELHHDESIDEERPKGVSKPPGLFVLRGEGGVQHRMGRIDLAVGARYTSYDYQDAVTNDGSILDQDARSFSVLEPFVALGHRLSPGYRVFTEIAGRHVENRGDDRIDRDAEGVRAMAGAELELSPLVRLTLKGGYFYQDYLQAGLIDIATGIYEGRLDWYVSPLVTLTFSTRRDVQATSYGEASGRITTSYSAKADYEMWRNLILSGDVSLRWSEYIGENRSDQVWIGRIGLDYLASKNWLFTLGYEHQELTSSTSDLDRKFDKVTIGAKYRF